VIIEDWPATTTPTDPTAPTANSPQPSSPYSGARPTNPRPHSDWTPNGSPSYQSSARYAASCTTD
jgi:hypothetical protein